MNIHIVLYSHHVGKNPSDAYQQNIFWWRVTEAKNEIVEYEMAIQSGEERKTDVLCDRAEEFQEINTVERG